MSNEADTKIGSDTPAEIIVGAGPSRDGGLSIDLLRFKTWLHENFAVLEWERVATPRPHYEFAIDFPTETDPAFQIEGLIYEEAPKDIAFGRATPRFTAGFLAALIEHFPENADIITIIDDRICARFDASLGEDDTVAHLLSHDEALARALADHD